MNREEKDMQALCLAILGLGQPSKLSDVEMNETFVIIFMLIVTLSSERDETKG